MFRKDRFLEDCRAAVGEGQKAIRELVLEAVSDPASVIAELGEPTKAGVYPLHKADDLTVINFVWAPCMTLLPHNHNMFAVIGIYSGREDNMFWRRIADDAASPGIEAAGAESMRFAESCSRRAAVSTESLGCRISPRHRSMAPALDCAIKRSERFFRLAPVSGSTRLF